MPGSVKARILAVAVTAIAAATLAAPARAATVSVAGTTLTYAAAAAEVNVPVITYSGAGPKYVVSDSVALTAGAGCTLVVATVECADTGITQLVVNLDNLDDRGGRIDPGVGARYTVNGGDGNDSFSGGSGQGTMTGGPGDDELTGGGGDDTLSGEGGLDTLRGGDGEDLITGGDNNDTLFGGRGNDRLNGNGGDDTENGEGGQDEFAGAEDPGGDTFSGGPEPDIISYASSSVPVTVTLDDVRNDGPHATDDVRSDVEHINGSNGPDNLTGSAASNIIQGNLGSDVINGLGGDDLLWGTDFLSRGGGVDIVNGGDGDDQVIDGGGDDVLSGDAGNDVITGGTGTDVLNGGPGIDTADWGGFTTYPNAFERGSLVITLDDVADDGFANEGDNVRSDIENVDGGFFNAFIRGSAAPNIIIADGYNDTIDVRGGGADVVGCGGGFDTVTGDREDRVDPPDSGFCESVDLGPAPVPPVTPAVTPPSAPTIGVSVVSTRLTGGVLRLRLTCGAAAVGACEGGFTLTNAERRVGSGRYELAPAERETLRVTLPLSLRRQLARGRRVRLVLRVTVRDNTGLVRLVRRTVTVRRR